MSSDNINNGMTLETASSVIARDMIRNHLAQFQYAIRNDRAASMSTVAAYIDGLAGAVAFTIAGGQSSRDNAIEHVKAKLVEAIDRDLAMLRKA